MKSEIFFLRDSVLDYIKSSLFVSIHVTSNSPLHVPSCTIFYSLLRHTEGIVDDSLLQSQTEQKLTNPVDVGTIVSVLDDCFTC